METSLMSETELGDPEQHQRDQPVPGIESQSHGTGMREKGKGKERERERENGIDVEREGMELDP